MTISELLANHWLVILGFCALMSMNLLGNRQQAQAIRDILRDVTPSSKAGNGKSGDKPVEFWQQHTREAVEDALVNIMGAQNELLRGIAASSGRVEVQLAKLVTISEQQFRYSGGSQETR
jgi:hypothetical protein